MGEALETLGRGFFSTQSSGNQEKSKSRGSESYLWNLESGGQEDFGAVLENQQSTHHNDI